MPERSSNLITTLLLMSACMVAQHAVAEPDADPPPPVSPCSQDSGPARAFDFWIGEWTVVQPGSETVAGTNRIRLREDGCLLVEEWTGASGSTGMSMNFYDPARGAWRQIWQSRGALIELEGDLDELGRMMMEGSIFNHAQGVQAPFRGRWTPRDDGTVLQEFWQQDDEGSWGPWFVGEYRRVP